jgi:hypothetical protein
MLLSVAFLGLSLNQFLDHQQSLGPYGLGMSKDEGLYGFGKPKAVRTGDSGAWISGPDQNAAKAYDRWNYVDSTSGSVEFAFDPTTSLATRLSCSNAEHVRAACPGAFRVHIGDVEDMVVYHLGRPSRIEYRGPRKIMAYPELGVEFALREFHVEQITVQKHGSDFAEQFGRFIRWLVP